MNFLLLCCYYLISFARAIKVVVFLPGTTQFEKTSLNFIAQALAMHNHDTSTFEAVMIPEKPMLVKHKLYGVREVTVKNSVSTDVFEPLTLLGNEIPWRPGYDRVQYRIPYWIAYNQSCHRILTERKAMDRLRGGDVALVYAGNACHLAIVHALAIPFIYYDMSGFSDETAVTAGLTLSADLPSSETNFPLPLNWWQRLINTGKYLAEYAAQSGYPFALISERYNKMDRPISRMFREDSELSKRFRHFPEVDEIRKKAELFFVNTDSLIEYPRLLAANVIFVGGMHIDYVKPLFEPWNRSMRSAKEGVIVCSLGTMANSSNMPLSMARAFAGAFNQLGKNRIFWRVGPSFHIQGFDTDQFHDHINLSTYVPQSDLLAAKETRLFITNGGMHSVMEAVTNGVPMLGIPLYGSNYANLRKIEAKGLGLILDKNNLTEKTLLDTIRRLLRDPKYKLKAKELSQIIKERPMSPFETALYWIEYVGRNHGAIHVKPNIDSNMIKVLNLDLIFIFLILPLITAKVVFVLCHWMFATKEIPTVTVAAKQSNH